MSQELELFPQEKLEANGSVELPQPKKIQDPEWCFQFFNNEPVVIGYQGDANDDVQPLVMQVQPLEGQGLVFNQNGMQFRIFAREISEETKKESNTIFA